MSANNALHIAVLGGDGIGPEVMAPALEVLRRIEAKPDLKFRFTEAPAGANHYRETGRVDARIDGKAVRRGRCDPARRLRAARRALSRRHRDHAAGRTALHLRPLCRRPPGAADPGRAEPDRRRGRARHRSGRDPRIHRRPVRLDGQGVVTENEARETLVITRKTSEQLFEFSFRLAERRKARGRVGAA